MQEWLASGRMPPGPGPAENDRDINQLLVAYWEFAQGYYVKNSRPTGEIRNLKEAFRPLAKLYGSLPGELFVTTTVLGTVGEGGRIDTHVRRDFILMPVSHMSHVL